ncbi:MAG: CPP1-like family protein [Elainellaceae cyanobacterium]
MSAENHYETLGVDDNSSFEEIRDARDRILADCKEDESRSEAIEMAYDAILMERLRMRQEGKIKVPDRIRFPERVVEVPAKPTSAPSRQGPEWVKRLLDTPSRNDILWPALAFSAAAMLSVFSSGSGEGGSQSFGIALGVILTLFFVNRKENKFLRAFLLTMVGLVVGVTVGEYLGGAAEAQLEALSLTAEGFASIVTLFVFWLISSFLR